MKVLVTSSTGLTGKAVVRALASRNVEVRAMVHSAKRSDEMLATGASEIFAGDISSRKDLLKSMTGVDAVYYICPTAREDESEIGRLAVAVAKEAGVNRFIYQSVLHSIEPELPHHRMKLEVERTLVNSCMVYSIVQPAPFMQNILNSREALLSSGVFVQKFFKSVDSVNRLNLIDVNDFGECVAEIIPGSKYRYSTLELCGPENLNATEMLSAIRDVTGKEIELRYISDDEMRNSMSRRNASEYSIDTLLRMFHHYNNGDFCGSDVVASEIIHRDLVTFTQFLKRELK